MKGVNPGGKGSGKGGGPRKCPGMRTALWLLGQRTVRPGRRAPRKPEREMLAPRSGPWKMTPRALWRVGKRCRRSQPQTLKNIIKLVKK